MFEDLIKEPIKKKPRFKFNFDIENLDKYYDVDDYKKNGPYCYHCGSEQAMQIKDVLTQKYTIEYQCITCGAKWEEIRDHNLEIESVKPII